jgi:hypothetical protein
MPQACPAAIRNCRCPLGHADDRALALMRCKPLNWWLAVDFACVPLSERTPTSSVTR